MSKIDTKTTEFAIRMFADQIAEGTYFSMVELNDSTLISSFNIESFFTDVFFDSIIESFGSPEGSVLNEESFGEHMASVMFDRIDMDRFVGFVQSLVNTMLVEQARKNISAGSED